MWDHNHITWEFGSIFQQAEAWYFFSEEMLYVSHLIYFGLKWIKYFDFLMQVSIRSFWWI